MQQQPYNPFIGIDTATPGIERLTPPQAGWYLVEIERAQCFEITNPASRMRGELAYVCEFKIKESAPSGTGAQPSPIGARHNWFRPMARNQQDAYRRELQGFHLAVLGAKIEECAQPLAALAQASGDARNLYMGFLFACEVSTELDKDQKIDPKTGRVRVYHNFRFHPGPARQFEIAMQRLQAAPQHVPLPPRAQPPQPQQFAQPAYGQPAPQPQYGQAPAGHGQPMMPGMPPQPQYAGQPGMMPAYAQSGPQAAILFQQAPAPAPQQWGAPPAPAQAPPFGAAPPWGPPQAQPQAGPPAPQQWGAPAPAAPPNPFGSAPMPPPPGYRWDPAVGRFVPG